MYKLFCTIFSTGKGKSDQPALVTACNITYDDLKPGAQITCADGSVLVKRMSVDYFRNMVEQIVSKHDGLADIRDSGAWLRLPPATDAPDGRAVNREVFQNTTPGWDTVPGDKARSGVGLMDLGGIEKGFHL